MAGITIELNSLKDRICEWAHNQIENGEDPCLGVSFTHEGREVLREQTLSYWARDYVPIPKRRIYFLHGAKIVSSLNGVRRTESRHRSFEEALKGVSDCRKASRNH